MTYGVEKPAASTAQVAFLDWAGLRKWRKRDRMDQVYAELRKTQERAKLVRGVFPG